MISPVREGRDPSRRSTGRRIRRPGPRRPGAGASRPTRGRGGPWRRGGSGPTCGARAGRRTRWGRCGGGRRGTGRRGRSRSSWEISPDVRDAEEGNAHPCPKTRHRDERKVAAHGAIATRKLRGRAPLTKRATPFAEVWCEFRAGPGLRYQCWARDRGNCRCASDRRFRVSGFSWQSAESSGGRPHVPGRA